MISNYIKIAFRNLVKNKTYSLINIIGLSIGLASSIMVLLYLKNELTYDNMHMDKSSIYRVAFDLKMQNSEVKSAIITAAVAPSLLDEFPEIESMTRLRYPSNDFFMYDNKNYKSERVSFADSTFFEFFSFKLISGTPKAVLNEKYSVVLTESLAKKIFGNQDPIGKVIYWNNAYPVVVKGISEDCPQNSSINYTALISFSTLYDQPDMYMGWNGGNQFYNFIKLHKESSIESVKSKLEPFLEKKINYLYKKSGWVMRLAFDCLDDMHFHGIKTNDQFSGDLVKLRLIGLIGFFVILIAIFNFINLSTAQFGKRSIEIGIRKVIGANRLMISKQFLGEAIIFSLFSFIISLILVEIFQPQFSQFIGNYELYTQSNTFFIIGLIGLSILTGILAGIYPALRIARLQTIKSLKGRSLNRGRKPYLRNTLVVIQFIISTVFTTYTIVMIMQMISLQKKDMGFESEGSIIINMPSKNAIKKAPQFKTELKNYADIQSVSSTNCIIGRFVTQNGYLPEGLSSSKLIKFCAIDENMLDLLKLKIVKGRNFSSSHSLDKSAYIINESLAKEMNWDNPIGKRINRNGDHTIIGVVKDFHFQNVQLKIEPMIFGFVRDYEHNFTYIKLSSRNYQDAINKIETVWHKLFPEEPFNYMFYNDLLSDNYTEIRKSIRIMSIFALMVIIIACMGLYGLAMYTVERRFREIGIRKVFGAHTWDIAKLVIVDFLKWILIANVISIPIAYYYSIKFLDGFAYSINLNSIPFLISLCLSVFIALLTVLFQIIKLSKVSPIATIKYE